MILATKTTGSRFVFVKNKLALLERALSNFMLDKHVTKNGYQEISPPLIASKIQCLVLVNYQNLKMINLKLNLMRVHDRKFLIPTAEVILTNIVKDKIVDIKDLPNEICCLNTLF